MCRSRGPLGAVSSATRRAVSSSPPPRPRDCGAGAGRAQSGRRRISDSSGSAGGWSQGGASPFGWGAAVLLAAPICGLALKAQLDPDARDWLSHRLLLPEVSSAACEAAADTDKHAGTPAMTEAEMASEVARDKAVRDQLLSELERVRAERDALDEQRQALQIALEEHAKRPPTTIVQQEVKYAESWSAKIAELLAARTTERVLDVMQQPIATGADATPSSSIQLGIISEEGLDLSKEPAMAESVSVELAQERLRALLLELHHRTRLEGVRLSEAIKATEVCTHKHSHMHTHTQKCS